MKAGHLSVPLLCLVFLSTGCMAWMARTEKGGSDWVVYKGVSLFVHFHEGDGEWSWWWVLVYLDLPLTVVADTVLLPFDLAWWLDPPSSILVPDD